MMEAFAIFIGGGLGSVSRFGLGRWLGFSSTGFPIGTLAANLLACLILGFLGGVIVHKNNISPAIKLGIATGFCGGFSTFSTFSLETVGLFDQGKVFLGILYVALSIIFCFLGVWLGQLLGRAVV
jgi:CrcB protein